MKRVFAIAICFSIFYAGAVWALAACEKVNDLSSQYKSAALFDSHHHRADHDSNHSHSGPGAAKVHCPGVFGEFLLTARASLGSGYSPVEHKNYLVLPLAQSVIPTASYQSNHGPTVSSFSLLPSRHLFSSVLRI